MEAIQFDKKKKQLSLIKTPIPKHVGNDEVLVRVAYAGICGTDLHIADGSFPCSDNPVVLGHEFSGVVESIGTKVTHVKKGDNVVVDPNSGCNTCDYCHFGSYHNCKTGGINSTIGIYRNGGWAQYSLVPAVQVHKVPDNISLEHAALTEPLSCISHGWDRISPIPVGSSILILGAGIIGNLWCCVLHLQGHRNVIVSEPQETRRKLLQNLALDYEIVAADELKKRKANDPSWGVDLVIDCSGFAPAMEHALTLINPGGKLCVFGISSPEAKISVSPYHLYKNEISIIAVNINPFSFPQALGWISSMGSRYLSYEKLGIKIFTLKEYKTAIEELRKGSIAKAMYKIEH